MTSFQSNFSSTSKDLKHLWQEWAIAFGAPILIIFLSWFISRTWLPLVVFALAWFMRMYALGNHYYEQRRCMRMVHLSSTALFLSGIIMLVCVIITRTDYFGPKTYIYEGFNPQIPYIVALIVFPMMTLVMLKALIFDRYTRYCRGCVMHSQFDSSHDIEYTNSRCETRYQERLMLWLSLLISAMNWTYYLLFYININLNTPDRFYFIFAPTLVYGLSLLFLAQRYFMMTQEFSIPAVTDNSPTRGIIRFLIIRGDEMLLNLGEEECEYPYDVTEQADTPAVAELKTGRKPTSKDAAEAFSRLSGLSTDSFTVKRLYTTANAAQNLLISHYGVVIDPEVELPADFRLGHDWVPLNELDRRLRAGIVAPMLAGEMKRILTMTMAWKTYDSEGRRLYPIKNYRPTFRLRDFKDWTIDYADPIWLAVAVDNEDKPLWRVRRMMRRLTHPRTLQR